MGRPGKSPEGVGKSREGPGGADTHLSLAAAARGRSASPPPSLRLPGAGRRLRGAGGRSAHAQGGAGGLSFRLIKKLWILLIWWRLWGSVRLMCCLALPCQPGCVALGGVSSVSFLRV